MGAFRGLLVEAMREKLLQAQPGGSGGAKEVGLEERKAEKGVSTSLWGGIN